METLSSFPQFSEFPLEVQDRIWELAIPLFPNAAYEVNLDLDRAPTRIRGKTQFVDQVFTVFRLVPNKADTYTACQILRATSRRAAAAADRVTAAELMPVDGFINGSATVEVRTPPRKSTEGQHILTHSRPPFHARVYKDLMILAPPGQRQILQLFFGHTIASVNLGLKPEVRRPNSELNHLAVPWPTVAFPYVQEFRAGQPFWLRAGAMLMGLFPHLQALYAVVDPDEIARMDGTHWNIQDVFGRATVDAEHLFESLRPEHEPNPRRYPMISSGKMRLSAYEEGVKTMSKEMRFCDGEREYFEVPYEQVQRCGELLRAMVMLEGARYRALKMMEGLYTSHDRTIRISPLRCRIMTWRKV